MNILEAPFTQEQVDKINKWQNSWDYHPFTCCSPEEIEECLRANKQGKTFEENEGLLIATLDGFVCPCSKYTQDWCYEFMTK
jgi:hypothetical protein